MDIEALSYICPRFDIVVADTAVLREFNINVTELIEACDNYTRIVRNSFKRERQGESLSKVIPITVVYTLIFITGLVGNITTCFVIVRNRYMHTATNYYLFNLAITDILVLILGLPQELYTFWYANEWIFGNAFCVIRTFAAEACSNASILSITAFTIERYIAICHPLRSKLFSLSKLGRCLKIIAMLWVISCLCAIPMSLQFGIEHKKNRDNGILSESTVCKLRKELHIKSTFELSTFLFFVTPMTIIMVLYILMGMTIFRTSEDYDRNDSGMQSTTDVRTAYNMNQRLRSRRSVIKLLVAVVVAFFVCWAPFHVQRLMVVYVSNWTRHMLEIHDKLYYISGVFYYVSSTINPILYNIMSLKFRQAFVNTLASCCRKRRVTNRTAVSYHFNMNTRTQPVTSSQESSAARRFRTFAVYGKANGNANIVLNTPVMDKRPAYFNGPCSLP